MTEPSNPHPDPEFASGETEALASLEQRLQASRPVPHPGFRGMLRQQLVTERPALSPRPLRLHALIAAYGSAGTVLLIVAGVGVLGSGPFAT